MIEGIIQQFGQHPDIVRVTVSDREGLLIAAVEGPASGEATADQETTDDLWNAYMAQFASNLKVHLKNLTLARPLELVIHGSDDDVIIIWLSVGWLIARVRSSADWPSLWQTIRDVRKDFDALTGEPVYAGSAS